MERGGVKGKGGDIGYFQMHYCGDRFGVATCGNHRG